MAGDLLLGVDAGQTVTKAVLFDADGRERGAGSARVELSSPRPRWVERDMDAVWAAAVEAIRGCLGAAGTSARRVAAVGIVGHNDGLYLVDGSGRPVRPAVTAMDTRAYEVLAGWRGGPVWSRALELTGQVPYAGSPSTLLAWFAANEPAALERARWVLFCKDWLRLRMTGEVATDPSEASAAFTCVRTQGYAPAALELVGLERMASALPPIRRSAEVAGAVTADAAAATGLPPGTPVVTGCHDVDGVAIGSGVVDPGTLSLSAGTFSINQVVSDRVVVDERWQARSFVEPGRWLNMATSPSSATNLEWLLGVLGVAGGDGIYGEVDAAVRSVLAGPSPVLYHPFLYGSPYGEQASGAFLGLRGWHGRPQLYRAVCEGVVLGHRVHVDALRDGFPLGPVARLSGGAARSELWAQMFADALDLEVEVTDSAEAGARGAALLAGLGVGVYDTLAQAAGTAGVARRHRPDPARREVLGQAYGRFLRAAESLRPLWSELG